MSSQERAGKAVGSTKLTVPGQTRFFDRKPEMQTGLAQVQAAIEEEGSFSLLEVVGPGGVGKSRLLRELRDSTKERVTSPERVIWVPLSTERTAGASGPLSRIRNEFGGHCLLHDTALLSYWNAVMQPLRVETSDSLANSLPVRFLQEGGKAAGVPLPLGFGLDLLSFARKKWAQAKLYDAEEFEVIDELRDDPEELLKLLPQLLASDIARSLEPYEQLVVFYDNYEKQKQKTIAAKAPWLRTFLGNLRLGVHFISSRERLRWDDFEIAEAITPLPVEPLPEAESRELIHAQRADLDDTAVERMLRTSRRLPLLLKSVVSGGKAPETGSDPIDHQLSHLEEPQRNMVIAMASIQIFDRELFEHIARELQLGVEVLAFDDFCTSFYVEELPPLLHKTHDLYTEFVHESESAAPRRRRALEAVSECLLRRCLRHRPCEVSALLQILAATVTGWYSVPDPPESAVDALIDAGYLLYDAGHWREIGSLPVSESMPDHPVSVAAEFLAALASRRTDGVGRARELFAALGGRISLLGRHRESAELETAYLEELSGDYRLARERFVDLAGRIDRFDPTSRLHVRSRLYLADMQIMDGDLEAGGRLLLESYEAELLSDFDWAELVRHRGHALRFSFLFEPAVDLYLRARRAAKKLELASLEAKLWTNLAEARCWSEPSLALGDADISIDMNERLGNKIEMAKCEAARAIALARLRCFEDASAAVEVARGHAERVGYPAAVAFAQQAEAISLGLQGEKQAAGAARRELGQMLARLGTYPHLVVAPLCAAGEIAELKRTVPAFGWQEPEGVIARIRDCMIG